MKCLFPSESFHSFTDSCVQPPTQETITRRTSQTILGHWDWRSKTSDLLHITPPNFTTLKKPWEAKCLFGKASTLDVTLWMFCAINAFSGVSLNQDGLSGYPADFRWKSSSKKLYPPGGWIRPHQGGETPCFSVRSNTSGKGSVFFWSLLNSTDFPNLYQNCHFSCNLCCTI